MADKRRNPIDFRVTGSKVKVNFGTLSIRPCWYDTDYSFCPITFKLPYHFQTLHVSCGWWEEEPYWFWVIWSKVKVNFGTLCIKPCGHDSDYSFCPLTFKLYIHIHHDERGTLLILGHGVKGQGQLWHFVYVRPCGHDTDFSFCPITFRLPNHFQTSHVSGGWWEKEPYWFVVTGSKVKVNFDSLCIRPYGHNRGYNLSPITFKLHM